MKRIFTLIAAALLCSLSLFAEKVKIGDLYYNLNGDNKTAEVTYENEYPSVNYAGLTTIVIPDSVQYADNYYAVTAIGIEAFHNCPALQSVVIPDNVQTIGESAFYLSEEIKSITLGSGVQTIGGYAFFGCETLVTITIPDNVQSIGENVFAFCSSLQSVAIGSGVQTIGEGTLENCPALATIDVAVGNPAYCSVEGVLFTKDTLTLLQHPTGNARIEYTIPANVQTIGASAFSECQNLQSVTIGNGVQTIGDIAFGGCSALTTIYNYATTPPSIEFYTFSQVPFDECTLYVPAASLTDYQEADGWKEFFLIQTIESIATGIENGEETKGEWTKVISNGQLLIIRDGKTFNAQGTQVK